MKTRSMLFSAILASFATLDVHADILLGGFGSDTSAAQPVQRFADDANNAATPIGSFYTDFTGNRLQTPAYMTHDPIEDVIYVSDFYGQSIRVYADGASGNTTPLRAFTSPLLGQPRQTVVDVADDELISIVSNCCIGAFARKSTGNVAASRSIQWGGVSGSVTRLNNPGGLAWRPSSDELIVSEQDAGTHAGVLLFFDRNANGNAAPTRTIEGLATKLGDYVIGVIYDAPHDEIIVASEEQNTTYRIAVFSGMASGNAVPTRTIEGPLTQLSAVESIAYDATLDLIFVSQGGNGPPAKMLAFPRTGSGNLIPTRSISSASMPAFPGAMVFVPSGRIFAGGFDG